LSSELDVKVKDLANKLEALVCPIPQRGSCFIALTLVHGTNDSGPIENCRIGQRVTTSGGTTGSKPPRLERLRVVRCATKNVEIAVLRSHDWIEDYGAHVGGSVYLDMPEMGVEGQAEVLAIEPCPTLEEGEGRLVTGTFKHTSGDVYDLKLESESKPIGVTATHPFWSVDREAWVSAIDLEIGERLKTLAGTTVVESRTKWEEPETVYNIEVEGDHCYRVGQSGVLVHNASAPCCSGLTSGVTSPVQNVTVGGRTVPIYGTGQSTGSINCPNGVNKHRQASINLAVQAANTGSYEFCTMNRAWSTSTGVSTDSRRPDVICVRCDGKVDAWEAISATDDPVILAARLSAGMASLPIANRGTAISPVPLFC
jgi:hypothetical protein